MSGDGGGPAFTRGGALALIAVGMALLLALLYLIGAGEEFGGERGTGQAHAAANGLNGYAGLVRLVEAEGYNVTRSRSQAGLVTEDLLVLTPPEGTDPKALFDLLQRREAIGPTLVILPKWFASGPPPGLPAEAAGKFKRGWVELNGSDAQAWTADLPAPYGFTSVAEQLEPDEAPDWDGLGLAGALPTRTLVYAQDNPLHEPLVQDAAGHTLALKVLGKEGSEYYDNSHWTLFVTEPDLMNNYGLADRNRANAALALVRAANYDDDEITGVVFDLTLNGFGASENLLTLAFRPPFLAATLCLLLTLLIIGWRAFQRFGPPAGAAGPDIAFGKRQLIANGAGLILRARRFALLAAPYAALSSRRIAERLGLSRADGAAIDAALARRLPSEEPFTSRAARLEGASKPANILSAAQALDDLSAKLSHQAITGTMQQ
jgi:hypothetical protein